MPTKTSILIPTYNQPTALMKCLKSIIQWTHSIYEITVIDNSDDKYADKIVRSLSDKIRVLEPDGNLGWIGGINLGIQNTDGEYVLFMNDDCFPTDFQEDWLQKMLSTFHYSPKIGAVGPVSNHILPQQNILKTEAQQVIHLSSMLSGMCFLTKRSIINEIGLLDENLEGADDLDYSLRLLKSNYVTAIRRDVFFYHMNSLTGHSVQGDFYNSKDQQDGFTAGIIRKHGLKNYLKLDGRNAEYDKFITMGFDVDLWEKQIIIPWCKGKGADIGCGAFKITPDSIGVDLTPKGSYGKAGSQVYAKSQADIQVTDIKLPFKDDELQYVVVSHCLEHIIDDMAALEEWVRVLQTGGYLIIAVPDEDRVDGIPLDPTHKHTYTEESLKRKLGYLAKFEVMSVDKKVISMVMVFRILK